jgi:N,N'-diacetylchitobiose transport system substrate-binding protein
MQHRRTSALTAVIAAVALTATACGGGGGSAEDPSAGDTGAGDPGAAEEATAASGEGETLSVWIMEGTNPDAEPFFVDVAEDFEAETGAELDVQFVPWASAHDQFVTSIAGSTGPDVAEVGTTWTPEFAEAGALVDLSERVESTGMSGDLVDGLVEAGTVDGTLYGMPWYAGVRSVIYRTDVFEEHGLEPPTTWEEWVEVGTTIRDAEPEMIAMPVPGASEYGVYPFIWGAGGNIAVQEGDTWTSTIDSPEAQEGIAFYTGLATEHNLSTPAATTWNEADTLEAFVAGDVAMMISGSWTPATILEQNPDLEGNIGAFPIPGPDGGLSPSFVGGSHLAVFESSDIKDLAWEFIELMSSEEYAQMWAEQSSFFPGLNSLLAEAQAQDDPLVSPFATQMEQAGASVPVTPAYGAVQGQQTVTAMLQSILSGDASVEEATAAAAAEMDDTLGS